MGKTKILYQISTHWDREWYRTFQGFRYYLVEMFDRLIEDLENEKISKFTFDGQTVVLEDYLEIRPENETRVVNLITKGKLIVGPWYVMPDELLVSGESIVENLLVGHGVAAKFGSEAWKFGYANDIFGHIAQLPQILNGFNIHSVYLGRGAENERRFIWKSPDGSECFTYCSNYANLKRTIDETDDKKAYLLSRIKTETKKDVPVTLLNYTDDHAVTDETTAEFEKSITSLDGYNVEYGFEKLAEQMQKYRDKLPMKRGELIKTAKTADDFRAVTDSISSYYPLKQANDRCENNLYNVLAPLLVMSEMAGAFNKRAFFNTARKYLLKNQPHDSICGCSVDAVHRNMPYRYNQANEIVSVMQEEFITKMTANADKSNEYTLAVFNFDLNEINGVVTIDIDFPVAWENVFVGNAGFQKVNKFRIKDESGKDLEYQILDIKYSEEIYNRQNVVKVDKYKIAIDTKIKPFGITCLKIVDAEELNNIPSDCSVGVLKAENEFLSISVSNGEIDITDKVTGKIYKNCNSLVDEADGGNGWFYENVGHGAYAFVPTFLGAEIVRFGRLVKEFKLNYVIKAPAYLVAATRRRSTETVEMSISVFLTLKKGKKYVEFKTIVDNTPKDHRLRALFPTEIEGESYMASQAFCFVKRNRGVSQCGINYREPESYEKNTAGIIGVTNDEKKCYFVAKEGIHQAGVYPDGTISVVLFRSFGHEFHEVHAKAAQINGELEFDYALCFDNKGLFSIQKELGRTMPTSLRRGTLEGVAGILSLSGGNIEVSIVKPAERTDGIIIRLFNPVDAKNKAKLKIGIRNAEVYEVDLEENIIERVIVADKAVNIDFKPFKIKTFLIKYKIE